MTEAILRKEIHSIIDTIPARSLPALRPLLVHLADDYWKPVIEPAGEEEVAMVEERMKDYETEPQNWVSIRDI
jgi:hypothetical protein